jgi:signal transduction histidine kinase
MKPATSSGPAALGSRPLSAREGATTPDAVNHTTREVMRRWGRFGITTRLMAGHTLLLMLVIGVIVWQSDRVITQRLERALNADLVDEVSEFSDAAETRPSAQSLASFSVHYLQSHGQGHRHLLMVSLQPSGPGSTPRGMMAAPGAAFLSRAAPVARWLSHPPRTATLVTIRLAGGNYRVMGSPLLIDGRDVGTFVAAANLATLNPDRSRQIALAATEGLAALLAAVVGGYLLLRRVLRTVNKVTQAAEEARRGDLSQRLSDAGPDDEVGRLAGTMNQMLAQLDTSFSAQRRLLADVSHQLRTPLTVARGHLEVLARSDNASSAEQHEAVALVIDELTQMSLMVGRLLLLGQALEPDFLHEETLDLRELLAELSDAARVMAPRNWWLGPVPALTVQGDRAKLRGALLNLIDNAVKATTDDDSIGISATVDGELVIEISDTGRGIPADDQVVVFDRFRRSAGNAYSGSGLGLAIAKAVAEAHDGRVELSSTVDEGTQVRIILPAARLSPAATPVTSPREAR